MTQAEYDKLRDEKLPDLCKAIDEFTESKITSAGILYINSEKADHKSFSTIFLSLFTTREEFREYLPLLTAAPFPTYFLESFKTYFRDHLKKKKVKGHSLIAELENFSYDGFVPFVSVTDASQILFFHSQTSKIAELDFKTYAMTTPKDRQMNPVPAVVEFNPYRPEQIYNQDNGYGRNCSHINTYKKPEWQLARELTDAEKKVSCKLPAIIDDFFQHLFPDSLCREFIYDWLHHAITLRCETYLVLNGAKGIGKNILSETICKALIGRDNHKLAQPGALESNFNAILAGSRMIVFDEFKIDDDDKINRLKRYINSEQMIERKGFDVGKTSVTYNSFIICSNSLHDMRIAWDDRRFSVADMTEVKLEEAWEKDKINQLIDLISDPESPLMREFGYWLLYRTPAKDEFHVYKGKHFYKLCYSSMFDWCKMIIDEVTSRQHEEIEEGALKMAYKERTNGMGRFPQLSKVEDFLKNYKHEGRTYLGEIKREGKAWSLVVNDEFACAKDSTGIEWEDVL